MVHTGAPLTPMRDSTLADGVARYSAPLRSSAYTSVRLTRSVSGSTSGVPPPQPASTTAASDDSRNSRRFTIRSPHRMSAEGQYSDTVPRMSGGARAGQRSACDFG